jgi:translation initiation factor 1
VRVLLDRKGRGGKSVTVVEGVRLGADELRKLAKELKRRTGTGGSVKDGRIEIQGDQRDLVISELESRGHEVRRVGG